MAVAGYIVANLTTNTTGWTSGLRSALGPLTTFATGVASLAAGAVLRFNSVGSALDDMRQRTGISAEELSRLSYAAKLSDTSLESLESGVTKMAQFMKSASDGGTEARKTLSELGLSFSMLQSASPEEQLGLFADALNQIPDIGERAAVAMRIFGKGAIDLIPLLSSGSDGLTAFGDEAERLGLVMNDETAASAAALGDSFDRLLAVGDSLLVQFGAEFAPLVTFIANEIGTWVSENRELISILAKSALVIASVVLAIKGLSYATQAYSKAQAFALALSGPKGWAQLAVALGAAAVATYALDKAVEADNQKLAQAEQATNNATTALHSHRDALNSVGETLRKADASAAELQKRLQTPAQQAQAEAQSLWEQWQKANREGASVGLRYEEIKRLQAQVIAERSGFADSFSSVSQEVRILRGELTETEAELQKFAEFGVDPRQIEQYRQMVQERNRLQNEQQAKERAAQEEQNRITATRDRVLSATKTPLQGFAEEVKAVNAAIAAGEISSAKGLAYLEQERKRLIEDAAASQQTVERRPQASNIGLDARSAEANQLILDLANRQGSSGEDKALEETRKQTEIAKKSERLLTDLRDDARRNALKTRSWGRRSA